MHRLFDAQAELKAGAIVHIRNAREIHHLKTVLRLKAGDPLLIFDGKGKEARATIQVVDDNIVSAVINEIVPNAQKKGPAIILACAVPKKSKFETIIEKCTELGVEEIIPLKTKRTILSLKPQDIPKKTLRYQTVAVNAAKQSQRSTVPKIHPITEFKQAITSLSKETLALIPCLNGQRQDLVTILKQTPAPSRIVIFIGPEGDFTEEEVALAIQAGCRPVSLGSTVLKVDTAAISTISFINLFFTHE